MITIGNRTLGAGRPCLVVAELGTGHLGSMARARELVDAAAASGADCAKLQLVYADEILHPRSGAVDLPTGRVELYRQFRDLEQPVSFYAELKRYVESKGLLFLCSPFGLRSARELRTLGVAALKIASPELNHVPLLQEAAGYGLPLVLSSGVSTLGDIERALAITGRERVVLLHCITAYPAPEDEYNVSLLASLAAVFGVEVGLSDHSLDPVLVPVLAVLHGARVVEKHFTLSRAGAGLDDPIALEPAAFARMVRGDPRGRGRRAGGYPAPPRDGLRRGAPPRRDRHGREGRSRRPSGRTTGAPTARSTPWRRSAAGSVHHRGDGGGAAHREGAAPGPRARVPARGDRAAGRAHHPRRRRRHLGGRGVARSRRGRGLYSRGEQHMVNLKEYIARERIAFIEADDKQDALAKLIALSEDDRLVIDFNQFQNAVLDREYIVTTGIGQNVAIPHIKSRWVRDFFITIGIFRNGVEWQSLDEKPVHLAFLIAGPEEHERYLRILAKLTLIIRDKEKRKAIIGASSPDEVYRLLENS